MVDDTAPRGTTAALLFQRRACSFSCENIIFNIEGYIFVCLMQVN